MFKKKTLIELRVNSENFLIELMFLAVRFWALEKNICNKPDSDYSKLRPEASHWLSLLTYLYFSLVNLLFVHICSGVTSADTTLSFATYFFREVLQMSTVHESHLNVFISSQNVPVSNVWICCFSTQMSQVCSTP